jgi:hypothetical protein
MSYKNIYLQVTQSVDFGALIKFQTKLLYYDIHTDIKLLQSKSIF